MISVEIANKEILSRANGFGIETISLQNVLGRVLAEDITADRDFPPFDRVAMDGICIRYTDYSNGQTSFPIQSTQGAGNPQQTLRHGLAIEIMTGASLSANADTVIRYEDLEIIDGVARIIITDVRHGQNVHTQGSDSAQNDVLLNANTFITPTVIGVLATVGKTEVRVYSFPKVAIISTGEELIEVGQIPEPHQIRKSNVHTLRALLTQQNIACDLMHLKDEKEDIKTKLSGVLETYDVVLLSGAVSKGKFDFIPDMLDQLGVEKHFHKVEQRPGKPFWFGTKGKTHVFAFPGNPVSTFLCAIRFFEPWLKKSLQIDQENQYGVLTEDVSFRPNLTYFLQVKLSNVKGQIWAKPIKGNGSGDLANLAHVDAFMELPSGQSEFKKGDVYPVWPFD